MPEENKDSEVEHSCSFCGKSQYEVGKIVIGPNVYICNDCVDLCATVIEESKGTQDEEVSIKSPQEVFNLLSEKVISQDAAKKIISVATYNHLLRIKDKNPETITKSNVLLTGPSGSGKTLICKTLSDLLHVPFAITDATALTEAGYVGEDVDTIITTLIEEAGGDISKAEKGIVYIDEIDKIATRKTASMSSKDVSGEGVQQGLLKIIEGSKIIVSPTFSKSQNQPQTKVSFDTSNVLFIFGGSFPGLDEIVSRRNNKMGIGLTAKVVKTDTNMEMYTNKDLEDYGLIKEFIGRIGFKSSLKELTEKELVEVMKDTKNSIISRFSNLFKKLDISLVFDNAALKAIAKKAIAEKVGARGLESIVNDLLVEVMFEVPSEKDFITSVVISKSVVEGKSKPLYIREKKKAVAES